MRFLLLPVLLLMPLCFAQTAPAVHVVETSRGTIRYAIDGPFAVAEGDIILGPAAEFETYRLALRNGERAPAPHSLTLIAGTSGAQLWPNATLYYTMDADVPNQQAVLDGIAYWNTHTPFKILPRGSEPNYVRFQHINIDAACNSYLGMIGGEQTLGITNSCPTGSVIHELGHAWGLFHEQQRTDRNTFLAVLYENIDKRFIGNFPQATSSATDTGYYDYDSIMHYPATGFSRNYLDALETIPPGIPIGQRSVLSVGDIDGVSRLYKIPVTTTTVTTIPVGLTMTVDGVIVTAPQAFNWPPGTQHIVSVNPTQGSEPRYLFARWSDGGAISHTITASASVTAISVQFVRQHSLAVGVSSGQGSVAVFPAAPDGYIGERAQLRLTAIPAPGYQFVRWVGNTALPGTGQGVSSNPAFVEAQNGPVSYQAIFTNGPLTTIDSKPRGALVVVDGATYLTPASFAFAVGSIHTLSYSTPQLFGNNTSRLQFSNWENGSTGSRSFIAVTFSTAYVANFTQQFLLSTSTSGPGTISTSPFSADGFYDEGTTVRLNATPGAGRNLNFWLGDVAGGALSSTIVMDQQRDATAYFGTPPAPRVLSAASLLSTSAVASPLTQIAPGEILAIFGANLGPATGLFGTFGPDGKMPFSLGGTTVTFGGVAAPLLYVSDMQIDAIVPYAVAGKTSSALKITAGILSYSANVAVDATSPALFTYDGSGLGQIAAGNEDGSINSPSNPAAPGSVVVLYATGAGTFDKTFPDGQVTGSDLGHTTAVVQVRFGKLAGDVLYAGTAPFLVNGALQVNVRLPADLIGGGPVPVQLLVGAAGSQTGVMISVAATP